MVKKFFILLFLYLLSYNLVAQKKADGCDNWIVKPYLYNDSISTISNVCFWDNYLYKTDTMDRKFFPDTLIICLHLIPSMTLWENRSIDNMDSYNIESELFFVVGESFDCYNIVNPEFSEPYPLLDSVINLKSAFHYINKQNVGFINISTIKIPMKELLRSMNIYTNAKEDSINWIDGTTTILNQIVISTRIYKKDKSYHRRFNFTLPINGPYCSGENPIYYE